MKVISKIIKIPNNENPSTEYVEKELAHIGINPLRWAIVGVDKEFYTISVADLKD